MSLYGQEIEFNPEYIAGAQISVQIAVDQTTGTVGAIVRNYGSAQNSTMTVTAVIPESTWAYNQYKNDYNLHSASNAIYRRRAGLDRGVNTANSVIGVAGALADVTGAVVDMVTPSGLVKDVLNPTTTGISRLASAAQNAVSSAGNAYTYIGGIDEITQDLTAISENYNAPAVGGVAQSNIFLAAQMTALSYGFKVPPLDIVKRIDKFLTVYGYKQSTYRSINTHARSSWTYIKTNGLNASGNFPDDDMNTIKRAFDKGIFFWSYTASFGNFDQSNIIV